MILELTYGLLSMVWPANSQVCTHVWQN